MDSNNWRVKRDPSDAPSPSGTPDRSFQRKGYNNDRNRNNERSQHFPRNGGQINQNAPVADRSFQSRDFRKPLNEPAANKAIEEGRRLYVGNLPYDTSVQDIETLFQDVDGLEAVNMSVDPMTGRNPSYCFIDLSSKDLAEGVMEMFNGRMFRQRPLKVKPGVRSGSGTGRFDLTPRQKQTNDTYAYDRWRKTDTPEDLSKSAVENERRVFVGGVPRFETQADANAQVRELFADFNVEVVAKVHPFYNPKEGYETSNVHYTFVDLSSAEEAKRAIAALDGITAFGGKIAVKLSKSHSGRLRERRRLFISGLPEFEGQETVESKVRELFEGYAIESISKLFLPKDDLKREEGNHCYCFIEFETEKDADKAQDEVNYKEIWGTTIRVKPAYHMPDRGIKEKQHWRS